MVEVEQVHYNQDQTLEETEAELAQQRKLIGSNNEKDGNVGLHGPYVDVVVNDVEQDITLVEDETSNVVIKEPAPMTILDGTACSTLVNDDVFHLPSWEMSGHSTQRSWSLNEEEPFLNCVLKEQEGCRTPIASISYSYNQEINLIKEWSRRKDGPPDPIYNGPYHNSSPNKNGLGSSGSVHFDDESSPLNRHCSNNSGPVKQNDLNCPSSLNKDGHVYIGPVQLKDVPIPLNHLISKSSGPPKNIVYESPIHGSDTPNPEEASPCSHAPILIGGRFNPNQDHDSEKTMGSKKSKKVRSSKRKRNVPRKIKKSENHLVDASVSTDVDSDDDQMEAYKTWDLGSKLGLVAQDTCKLSSELVKLRRSSRLRKESGVGKGQN